MRNRSDATTATQFRPGKIQDRPRSLLVEPAPGPESPDTRDKAGAQRGMIIILIGGAAFWIAVAALVTWLLR
jgi:hypothetical protein